MSDELRPKLVGARVRRLEDPRLLTGAGSFVDDRQPQRMAHVALRRSERAHARIVRLDCAAALQMPGVLGIFAAADIEGEAKPMRATSRMRSYQATSMHPLARGKVRFVGEAVAAVVAEDRYLAEDASEAIEVEYEELPDDALLHEEAGTNVIAEREFVRGDVGEGAVAAVRVRGRFRMTRKTPAALENRAYLAEYDSGRRALTLHSTTQVPGIVRDAISELLDVPGNRIRVIAPDVGGGFGGKASLYPEELLVCILARRLARPVKWTGDRLEDLLSTSQAFDETIEAELALDANGAIVALTADAVGDIGAYSIYPWTAALEPVQVVSFMPGPYRVPNYRGRTRAIASAKPPTGPYRGVGRPVSTFVTERLIDMAAHRMGLDPTELRLRNLVRDDEFPYKTASGIVWDRAGFVECLNRARGALGYEALRAEQSRARAAGRWLGIGFASYAELTGIGSRISASPGMPINTGTESSSVRIDSTGAVTAQFGIASHGQGLETSLAQVVADELGAALEDIQIVQGDSAASTHGTGSYASRSAVLAGGAATLAARAVREKVVRVAAHLLEAAAVDLDAAGGHVFIRGTDRSLSFREVARAVYSEMGRLPKELQEDLEATRLYDPFFGTATAATHAAVVEVDPETYQVRVLRYVVAEDCGRLINPLIVDGQVHGGVAQGIGAALYEEVVHDEAGQALTASFVDYLVPAASEIPEMQVIHLDTASPSTLGGFRGMGEGGTIGAPAAIANAISDALAPLGIEIDTLPATPERLFRLVAEARKGK